MRVLLLIATTITGVLLGLSGATLLGLAGLIWADGGLKRGPYWETAESESGVFLGSALLLGWMVSLIVTFVIARSGPKVVANVRTKPLSIALAALSISLTLTALVLMICVFPVQYTWMYY